MESIGPAELDEAVRSLELLRPRKISLLAAVTTFLGDLDRRTASQTLGEVYDAYTVLRARSKKYAQELRHTRKAIAGLLARSITDVTAPDLEKCLAGLAQSTRDSRVRRLRSVFGWAVRKGWLTTNVALRIDLHEVHHDEVEIYTPDEVEKLLKAAMEHDKALVPFLALCAFCGLRPEREAAHLLWSYVHLDDKQPSLFVHLITAKMSTAANIQSPFDTVALFVLTCPQKTSKKRISCMNG